MCSSCHCIALTVCSLLSALLVQDALEDLSHISCPGLHATCYCKGCTSCIVECTIRCESQFHVKHKKKKAHLLSTGELCVRCQVSACTRGRAGGRGRAAGSSPRHRVGSRGDSGTGSRGGAGRGGGARGAAVAGGGTVPPLRRSITEHEGITAFAIACLLLASVLAVGRCVIASGSGCRWCGCSRGRGRGSWRTSTGSSR